MPNVPNEPTDAPPKPHRRTRARKALLRAGVGLLVVVGVGAAFELRTGTGRHLVALSDGDRYLNAEDFARSEGRYTEAIELRPDDPKAYSGRAQARYRRGDWDGAVADGERAVELDPRFTGHRIVLAAAANLMQAPRRRRGHYVYRRAGRPCSRCGSLIRSWPQGDDARMAYWCPACQEGTEPRGA